MLMTLKELVLKAWAYPRVRAAVYGLLSVAGYVLLDSLSDGKFEWHSLTGAIAAGAAVGKTYLVLPVAHPDDPPKP